MLTVDYDRFDLQAGDRLLDLGCGFGRHTFEALARGAHVVSCDMARGELEAIRFTTATMANDGTIDARLLRAEIQGDGVSLPFADESFDKVIAAEVLEHVDDDLAAFDELMRVLRPGGTVAVTVPAELPERLCWRLSSDYHAPAAVGGHVRIYSKHEVCEKLSGAGLDPCGSHRSHALHSPYWWLRCAVGPDRAVEDNAAVRLYHRLLEWDIVSAPWITRSAERLLNPVLGKSLVVYADKSPLRAGTAPSARAPAHAAGGSDTPSGATESSNRSEMSAPGKEPSCAA